MSKFLLKVIFFSGIILPFYVYGQHPITNYEYEVETKQLEKTDTDYRNAISFAPINLLLDVVNPNIQIGYERLITKKLSLQIDGAIIIHHSIINCLIDLTFGTNINNCPYTNKGFGVRASVKYIVKSKAISPKSFQQFYISPELFYSRNKSGINRSFLISDPNFEYSFGKPQGEENAYTQFFYNDEEKIGINFKVGVKEFFGKHFFIEPFFILGIAYRNVIQTGRENPNDELVYGFGIFDIASTNKWVPSLPFNLKLGIRF